MEGLFVRAMAPKDATSAWLPSIGQHVQAKWIHGTQTGTGEGWYDAVVRRSNPNNTYHIVYDEDEVHWGDCPLSKLRPMPDDEVEIEVEDAAVEKTVPDVAMEETNRNSSELPEGIRMDRGPITKEYIKAHSPVREPKRASVPEPPPKRVSVVELFQEATTIEKRGEILHDVLARALASVSPKSEKPMGGPMSSSNTNRGRMGGGSSSSVPIEMETSCMELIYLAKMHSDSFKERKSQAEAGGNFVPTSCPPLTQILVDDGLLKCEISGMAVGPQPRQATLTLAVVLCRILFNLYQHEKQWPACFLKAYIHDCSASRTWVDCQECGPFTANLDASLKWRRKMGSKSAVPVQPHSVAPSEKEASKPKQEEANESSSSSSSSVVFPRYIDPGVMEMCDGEVAKCLQGKLNQLRQLELDKAGGHGGNPSAMLVGRPSSKPDSGSMGGGKELRNLISALMQAAYLPTVARYVVDHGFLNTWLQNPGLKESARNLLSSLAHAAAERQRARYSNSGSGGQNEAEAARQLADDLALLDSILQLPSKTNQKTHQTNQKFHQETLLRITRSDAIFMKRAVQYYAEREAEHMGFKSGVVPDSPRGNPNLQQHAVGLLYPDGIVKRRGLIFMALQVGLYSTCGDGIQIEV